MGEREALGQGELETEGEEEREEVPQRVKARVVAMGELDMEVVWQEVELRERVGARE